MKEMKEKVELNSIPPASSDGAETKCRVCEWDAIWARVGPLGLWQWLVVAVVGLSSYFGSQAIFMQAFVSTPFDHFCAPVDFKLHARMSPMVPAQMFSSEAVISHGSADYSDLRNEDAYYVGSDAQWMAYKKCYIPLEETYGTHNSEYNKCERYTRPQDSCLVNASLPALMSPLNHQSVNSATNTMNAVSDTAKPESCNLWIYNKSSAQYGSSIQIDFDLVCDRQWLRPFAQTITMFGQLVGVFLLGLLSDSYGRRPAMTGAGILGMISCILMAFAPSYWLFALAKFLTTASFTGTYTIGYVLVMELVGGSFHRTLIGQVVWVPYVIGGYIALPLLAWWFRHWRGLVLAIGLPSALLLLNICFLPESPRWLASKGRFQDASRAIRRAARINRRRSLPADNEIDWERLRSQIATGAVAAASVSRALKSSNTNKDDAENAAKNDANASFYQQHEERVLSTTSNENVTEPLSPSPPQNLSSPTTACRNHPIKRLLFGIRELFSRPLVRRRTLLLMFIWFVNSMVYYGLAFYSLQLPGNVFLNFAYGGIVEFPAYIFVIIMYHYCGRRWPLAAVLLFCGIVNLLVASIDAFGQLESLGTMILVLSTMAKFFISCSYAMIWVFTSELMPTSVRNAGTGLCSMFGRLGSAAAPQVQYVSRIMWSPLQLFLFGLLALSAALATIALPETKNHEILQSVDEAEHYKYVRRRRVSANRNESR